MHELPGFADASAAWTEVRTAASLFASARGPAVGEASARLRRATIAYADAWRRALDSLRGEFVGGTVIPVSTMGRYDMVAQVNVAVKTTTPACGHDTALVRHPDLGYEFRWCPRCGAYWEGEEGDGFDVLADWSTPDTAATATVTVPDLPACRAFLAASHRLRTSPPGADGGPERQSAIGDLVRAARLVPPSNNQRKDEP